MSRIKDYFKQAFKGVWFWIIYVIVFVSQTIEYQIFSSPISFMSIVEVILWSFVSPIGIFLVIFLIREYYRKHGFKDLQDEETGKIKNFFNWAFTRVWFWIIYIISIIRSVSIRTGDVNYTVGMMVGTFFAPLFIASIIYFIKRYYLKRGFKEKE